MATASPTDGDASQFVTDAVAVLHANGAETFRTIARARQLGRAVGLDPVLHAGWGASSLEFRRDDATDLRWFDAPPVSVGMNRVGAVDTVIDKLSAGSMTLPAARLALGQAAALPAANVFLFALACAVGATGLAVIFGLRHPQTALLIAASAALGAVLRRLIASQGGNNFWQAGMAAFLAGLVGALALKLDIGSAMRLAAVCPCMVLVPGPHLLNGSLDVAAARLPLGGARLGFAAVTLLAIAAGLLFGLTLGGAGLPPDPPAQTIPLWLDMITAGIVAVCYGIFYSAPLRMLFWPFLIGMIVHGVRWQAIEVWGLGAPLAAGLACLVAGCVLMPVSRKFHVPFAVVGFASVVSMMPGVLAFRALSGMVELQSASGSHAVTLLVATFNDCTAAFFTVALMALGFLIPAAAYARLDHRKVHP